MTAAIFHHRSHLECSLRTSRIMTVIDNMITCDIDERHAKAGRVELVIRRASGHSLVIVNNDFPQDG